MWWRVVRVVGAHSVVVAALPLEAEAARVVFVPAQDCLLRLEPITPLLSAAVVPQGREAIPVLHLAAKGVIPYLAPSPAQVVGLGVDQFPVAHLVETEALGTVGKE